MKFSRLKGSSEKITNVEVAFSTCFLLCISVLSIKVLLSWGGRGLLTGYILGNLVSCFEYMERFKHTNTAELRLL